MNIRETIEKREHEILSPNATKSADSRGRLKPEKKCDVRTDFQRDRDRIIHSRSFRRLKHKTQVFLSLEGDHYRTRLTHTIEVSQISRTITRALRLNEDLAEAIAMGHDLGHTPFGHRGETILDEIYSKGFRHNEQSLRVVDVLESSDGIKRGINLTMEVRDGILNHTGPGKPFTPEGQVVKISDRIAYINHDIDDAIRSGIITIADLPRESIAVLGDSHAKRIDTMVKDMIANSEDGIDIKLSDEKREAMNDLRAFMFENVYHNKAVRMEEDTNRVETIISFLFNYYMNHPDQMFDEICSMGADFDSEELVKDHVASMTDRYAINIYNQLLGNKSDT